MEQSLKADEQGVYYRAPSWAQSTWSSLLLVILLLSYLLNTALVVLESLKPSQIIEEMLGGLFHGLSGREIQGFSSITPSVFESTDRLLWLRPRYDCLQPRRWA